ncbi:unnamed protein product [Diatraea saccharalis]|uniref:Non-specific serine/threonine protein kinase n=1 Tax=Diatraea saccharalis TaxID=40085 RepID=A0A9N9WEA5_9NEOP|nr:unnamed protein product [Diatraea saccharalis]
MSDTEVKKQVMSLNNTNAEGHDEISTKIIKASIDKFISVLTFLINLSFSTGIYPNILKLSIIRPLFKKGEKSDIRNYRPITLVSILSKIFEKCMLSRLSDFCDKFNIIRPEQYGFQKNKSTTTAIFTLVKSILKGINKQLATTTVFFDLSKAFDFVQHNTLLNRLESAGIRGLPLDLICSYLKDRYQSVVITKLNQKNEIVSFTSEYRCNECGVPQGSVLGPFLFLIYINSLPEVTNHSCVLFADDISITVRSSDKIGNINVKDHEIDINNAVEAIGGCYADIKLSPAKKIHRNKVEAVCTCNMKGTQVLRVSQKNNRKVYIGNCLGHSSNGATTYLAIEDESGERLISKKWTISPASDFQMRNRQLSCIQQDLKVLCRTNHSSIVPYFAMEMVKETKRTGKMTFFLFRNYVHGCSLKCFLTMCKISDKYEALKLVRNIGVGVFEALKKLHSISVVHRDIRSENVFVDVLGAVKLVGASLDARFTEMHEGDDFCSRQTPAQDIYAAAQVLLSILSYEGTIHEIPPNLPSSAKDFFSRCLTDDEHSQWTAEQLVNHGFLVDQPVKQPRDKSKDEGSGSEDDDQVKKIHHVSPPTDGHSRLNDEFEVLTWLGKGAFGDVVKVKNKLDGGFYAIKRIKLNPENVQLNKKITREVKLLSRLNHENVVRYYNAWIESTVEAPESEEASTVEPPTKKKADSLEEVVAKLGQEVKVEWSISDKGTQPRSTDSESEGDADDDSDDDSDDERNPWYNVTKTEEKSEERSSGIEFQAASNPSETIPSADAPDTPRPHSILLHQVLFIQMEFCEKHTLRHAIDNGLFQEHFRAWRLFREIVEGLAHVHQRGMIHRDLKPVNIFLDSNDHVKIGDFGLATKALTGLPADDKSKQQQEMTGQVGTALYVAPELIQAVGKVIYNQKVDIYSLGIILFEMFHPPLSTGSERIKVLTNLRTKDIVIPKNFDTEEHSKQLHVIKWLLNHDASVRPTCAELLASEHVPRPVPEGALSGLLAHTLNDRGARCYQRLITACLDQKLSAAEDITYHGDVKSKPTELLENLKDIVINVFKSHGAKEFSPPLLMPRSKYWDSYANAVKVMTASGAVCHLPHDLRLPFARYIAFSGTKYMRRYIVDRIYREKHILGFHPREIIECAFDIVTPKIGKDSLWSDAELLMVANRCAGTLRVILQLNHTELLRILLLSCGVPLDKHADLYPVLVDVRFGRITNLQLQTHLTSLCVTDHDVANLISLMEADVPVYEVRELVTSLVKQPKWHKTAMQALADLESVYRNARALGCECPMTVAPFLAYNATQHSGVFWQMSAVRQADHKPSAKHRSGDVIAAGGRYDVLVEDFWKVTNDNAEMKCRSVGFSLSLERMAAIMKKMESELPTPVNNIESTLICVCISGTAGSNKEGILATRRAQLARDLWAGGFSCCPWLASSEDAHEMCKAGIVLQQDDLAVRVLCWGNDKVREHMLSSNTDVLDFVKQQLQPDTIRSPESGTNRSTSWNENDKSNGPNTSVTFITATDRMTKTSKRHCENQISTQINTILINLGLQPVLGRVKVHVLALACDAPMIRMLASQLSTPLNTEDLINAFQPVFDSFSKHQFILEETMKELKLVAKQSNQNRANDETQLYALYSITQSFCKLIT